MLSDQVAAACFVVCGIFCFLMAITIGFAIRKCHKFPLYQACVVDNDIPEIREPTVVAIVEFHVEEKVVRKRLDHGYGIVKHQVGDLIWIHYNVVEDKLVTPLSIKVMILIFGMLLFMAYMFGYSLPKEILSRV